MDSQFRWFSRQHNFLQIILKNISNRGFAIPFQVPKETASPRSEKSLVLVDQSYLLSGPKSNESTLQAKIVTKNDRKNPGERIRMQFTDIPNNPASLSRFQASFYYQIILSKRQRKIRWKKSAVSTIVSTFVAQNWGRRAP